MSRTAVLISGQMRTFAECVANQNWQLYRRLKNPVFFVSCADDEQAKDAYLLEGYGYPVHIEKVVQPTLDDPPFSLAKHAPYAPTPNNPTVVQSILRQLWAYKRVWDFHKEKDPELFYNYVRLRADTFFHRLDVPPVVLTDEFLGPWKATCGGVNDRFSFMGYRAALAYFNALDILPELLDAGCPLHPESIQQAALEKAGATIYNSLMVEFTIRRLRGDHVPLIEYPGEFARLITQG